MLMPQSHLTLGSLLRKVYARQATQCISQRRQYSADPLLPRAKNVAIIGGGITGLVSAYRLAKISPQSRITLYEASPKLGGWIDSRYVDAGEGRRILFERGPRTLRPVGVNADVTLQLVSELGLNDQVITTPKSAPSAVNRYIYDGQQLVRMPHPRDGLLSILSDCFQKPLLSGILSAAIREWSQPQRAAEVADESIGSFISRRFNSRIADYLASALFHGIYAGDIYTLSAASILKTPWFSEGRFGSLSMAALSAWRERLQYMQSRDLKMLEQLAQTSEDRRNMSDASIFSFRQGMQTLPQTLESKLREMPNVQFRCNTEIKSVQPREDGILLDFKTKGSSVHSLALATVSSRLLSSLTIGSKNERLSKNLANGPTVTVGLVNLYFPATASPLHPPGFGYLLPRTTPFLSNPERALGVIFDSDAITGQDIYPDSSVERGTKMTVMLGGHWWNDFDEYPTEKELSNMALSVLKRHLGINITPTLIQATLQRQCIPQYPVGHNQTMMALRTSLGDEYHGKLRVAGSSYTGVGVNDCVRAGWDSAEHIARNSNDRIKDSYTGLEMFEKGDEFQWVGVKSME